MSSFSVYQRTKIHFSMNNVVINVVNSENFNLQCDIAGANEFKIIRKINIYILLFIAAPWVNAKRRMKLRRDPTLDKGHRCKYLII